VTQVSKYELRLYITGLTPRSTRAIQTVREVCERHLCGQYDLEVIDVYQQPRRIAEDHIIAIPTLVKIAPPPLRLIVGDMTDRARLLGGLGLPLEISPESRMED
jgi:circadian clock protein KaiB